MTKRRTIYVRKDMLKATSSPILSGNVVQSTLMSNVMLVLVDIIERFSGQVLASFLILWFLHQGRILVLHGTASVLHSWRNRNSCMNVRLFRKCFYIPLQLPQAISRSVYNSAYSAYRMNRALLPC